MKKLLKECKKCGKTLIYENSNKRGFCWECEFNRSQNRLYWILGVVIGLTFIMLISVIIYYLYWGYPMQRDVWGVLDRAQITAESNDMLNLVREARLNLEQKIGLFSGVSQKQGHCALIFKEPSNSLDAQFLSIQNIEKRIERTNNFDKSSVEYQTAIDDIRGTIRELPYLDCWIWHFE